MKLGYAGAGIVAPECPDQIGRPDLRNLRIEAPLGHDHAPESASYRTKLTTASPNGSWHKLLRISICIDLRIEGGGGCSREFEGRYRMSIIGASTRRWRLFSLQHLESAGDRR